MFEVHNVKDRYIMLKVCTSFKDGYIMLKVGLYNVKDKGIWF